MNQTWSPGTYIIMLDDYSDQDIGQYFIQFECSLPVTMIPTTPSPISYLTTTDAPTTAIFTTFDVSSLTATSDMISSATSSDTSSTGMHEHSTCHSHTGPSPVDFFSILKTQSQ